MSATPIIDSIVIDGVDITSHGSGTGLQLTPRTQLGLDVLAEADLLGLLRAAGHLLIRGFDSDVHSFNRLVAAHSSRLTLDPAREFHGDVAQKVDSGTDAIGLHLENGATPFLPDLVWFHAVKAAALGSETTVCDGYRVWERLSGAAKREFLGRPLQFSRSVPEAAWRRFTARSMRSQPAPEDVDVDDLRDLASDADGKVVIRQLADGGIHYQFTVGAARVPRGASQVAWANSIFGPSYNYETPTIEFADGTPVPEDLLAECARVSEQVTEQIRWEDGDVVLIDNTRVMHGRRPILDTDRAILNAQSFAR